MGCGSSKSKEILEGCEKPLCHKMEKFEIDSIDSNFEKCSTIICQVEEKRKFLVDELIDNYYHTGAFAYKCPDPQKAFECAIWRLAVDNKGKVSEIGINSHEMCFEGKSNSEKGNLAANNIIGYMKCLTTEWKMEDLTAISDQMTEVVNEITSNMDNYSNEIKDKMSSEPMKLMKCVENLKGNLAKSTCALECIKQLCDKMRELCECAPALMENCTLEKLENQQSNVDKALKGKETENLGIAFSVLEANDRRGKTLKNVEDEYNTKLKARKDCLEKINAA